MKEPTEKERAFWREEIHLWKTDRDKLSWARWCQARELNADEMPRPLDVPPRNPTPLEPTSYDLKQEKRRRRVSNALKRAVRKEKRKQKEKERAARQTHE